MTINKAWNKIVDQYIININKDDLYKLSSWKTLFCELLNYTEDNFDCNRYISIKNKMCRPDIIITKDNKDLFIFEFRSKSVTNGQQNIIQLLHELKINIGVLLCKNLYIYNYNSTFDSYIVLEIPLEKNNTTGTEFIQFFSKSNFNKETINTFIEYNLNAYEIISVSTIPGNQLRANWNTKMQLIITNKGSFIDNIPHEQHGFFRVANPGYNWKEFEGKKIINPKIFDSRGYKWINHQYNTKVIEILELLKNEIPQQ